MNIEDIFNSLINKLATELTDTVIDDVVNSAIGDAYLKLSVDESMAFKKKLIESLKEHLHTNAGKVASAKEFVLDTPFEGSDYFAKISHTGLYSFTSDNPDLSKGRLIGVRKSLEYFRYKKNNEDVASN